MKLLAFALLFPLALMGQSTTSLVIGTGTTPGAAQSLGFNTFGGGASGGTVEANALAAIGVSGVRLNSLTWASFENPAGTYNLPANAVNDITNYSALGISPLGQIFPGPAYSAGCTVTLSGSGAIGDMQETFTVASGTCSSSQVPAAYIQPPSGVSAFASWYSGIYVTSITCAASGGAGDTCTIAFSVPLSTTAASGGTWTVNVGIYPPAASANPSDPTVIAAAKAQQQALTKMNAISNTYGVNSTVTFWNEPPWGPDCSDNRTDCFANPSGTGTVTPGTPSTLTLTSTVGYVPFAVGNFLTGSGTPAYPNQCKLVSLVSGTGFGASSFTLTNSTACNALSITTPQTFGTNWGGNGVNFPLAGNYANFGPAIYLQTAGTGGPYNNSASQKTGGAGLLNNPAILTTTGSTYSNTSSNPIATNESHPYGNNPEDKFCSYGVSACTNLLPFGSPNMYLLINSNYSAAYPLTNTITETGTFQSIAGPSSSQIQAARFNLRQFITAQADTFKRVYFYKSFDGPYTSPGYQPGYSWIDLTYGGAHCANTSQCQNATGFTPLASYTAMAGLMADIKAIPYTASSNACTGTVTSYSGTYQLNVVHLYGARKSGGKNSDLMFLVQMSNVGSNSCPANPSVVSASTTATFSSGSSTMTVASDTGIVNGQMVAGAGIVLGTTITISGTTVTLSNPASASAAGEPVTFSPAASTGCWFNLPSPAPGSAVVNVASGCHATGAKNMTTLTPVSYTVSGQAYTVPVADDEIEFDIEPNTGFQGTVNVKGQVSIKGVH